jgi:hypothetical protein
MKTQTTLENVTYGASGRRWTFEAPKFSYVDSHLHGGRATADKIARIINGGVKRTKGNGIDRLAEANINQTLHNARVAVRRETPPLPYVGFETESMSA